MPPAPTGRPALSWRTQIVKIADAYVLAGANLSVLRDNALQVLGRD